MSTLEGTPPSEQDIAMRESMGIDTASIQADFPACFVLLAAVAVTLAILILFTLFALRH